METEPKQAKATFAAGCFWGVQDAFDSQPGVISTTVGYTGGHTENPTYKEVCSDTTGHAEAIEVTFDPNRISFDDLLKTFWQIHNPTTFNRQGPDFGSQYRSAIFYHDEDQHNLAEKSLEETQKNLGDKIVTQIVPANEFYPAEEYHQHYHQKNGGMFSCRI